MRSLFPILGMLVLVGWDPPGERYIPCLHDISDLQDITDSSEIRAQDLWIEMGEDLPSQIVKIPHHGREDQDPSFALAVASEVALGSVGEDTCYRHPSADSVDAWEEAGAEFICTDEIGTVTISGNWEHLTIETEW